jgi:hypothetical protein
MSCPLQPSATTRSRRGLASAGQLGIEEIRVEAFHGAGVEAERCRAEKQPAEREIDLFFHPGADVAALPVQIKVGAARFRLVGRRGVVGEPPVAALLRQQGVELGVVQIGADAKDHDERGVARLGRVVGVGRRHGPREALLGVRALRQHEMPRWD